MQWNKIWINATLMTGEPGAAIIENGAIAVKDGKIAWLGKMEALPVAADAAAETVIDVKGQCILPGLIDCHTHLVFAGNRAHEFEKRLEGATYEEIARAGGGIQSTVKATRAASEEELLEQSLPRAKALMQSGVTTLEIKSGYGLDFATEAKILRVAKRIGEVLPLTVKRTFLGAHTVPLEYRGKTDDYIKLVCEDMIPQIAAEKLADAVDVFCEHIAFNIEQTDKVFAAAREHQLDVKCHGEQLTCSESAILAANHRALSVDHLEYASAAGIQAMADAGVVAVLLPGAYYFLREKQMPPISLMRELKVPMALASDCNPGTSPVMSQLLIMNMACTLFRMTPAEALQGVTLNAAKALGLDKSLGTLTVGKTADMVVFDVRSPVELCYYVSGVSVSAYVKSGEVFV